MRRLVEVWRRAAATAAYDYGTCPVRALQTLQYYRRFGTTIPTGGQSVPPHVATYGTVRIYTAVFSTCAVTITSTPYKGAG